MAVETKSIKGRICYRDTCPSCKKNKGFMAKQYLGLKCRGCANSIAKKGTTPWNKGKKTGQLVWNKGLKTSLISEEHKRLKHSMRTALNIRLKEHNLSKAYQTSFDLLGYSVEQLKTHLESKFLPRMTWDNYGDWHIDHITPDSWFTYSTVKDQGFKDSWTLNNLQPMWAEENVSKGARYSGSFREVI